MNKIYKTVWKEDISQFVAVSENAKGISKNSANGKKFKKIGKISGVIGVSFLLSVVSSSLYAAGAVYINDGIDAGCIKIMDSGGLSSVASAAGICNATPSTQTTESLFFGPTGTANDANGASSSLSLGQYLYVNGGKIGVTDILNGTYSMRLGSVPTLEAAIGLNSIAIGSSQTSTSTGSATMAAGNNSISIGSNASSDSNSSSSIALGQNSTIANASNALAIGNNAKVNGTTGSLSTNAMALGNGATVAAGATNAIAQGTNAQANAISTVALGNATTASASKAIAIGDNAKASSAESVAIGSAAVAQNGKAVSIGAGNTASGDGAVAIGDPNNATGAGAVALGKDNTANGDGAVALGNTSNAQGQGSVAIGYQSKTDAAGGVSLGDNAHTLASKGLALGSGAVANNANDVALGANSTTSTVVQTSSVTIAGTTYTFAGTNPSSTVSIGTSGNERTLTNVAAGRISATSTDAINGSQLYSTNQAIETLNTKTSLGLNFAANSGTTVNKKLGETLTIKGTGAKADTEYDSSNIKTTIDSSGNIIIGFAKDASLTSLTTGNAVLNTNGLVITNGPSVLATGINAGNLKITNVAAGTAATDAVNLSQLNTATAAAKTEVAAGTNVASVVKTTGANNQDIYTINANGTTASAGSSAVTVTKAATNSNNVTDYVVDLSQTTKDSLANADSGLQTVQTQIDGTNVKSINKTDNTANFVTGKNIQLSDDGQGGIKVATADDVDFNSVTVGNTTITSDGLTITNGPSITQNGISAANQKITDVADGTISVDSTDAINGSQIYSLSSNITQLFGGSALYVNNQIDWSNIGGTGLNNLNDAVQYLNDQAANANQGWKLTTDSGSNSTSTVKPNDTVSINGDTASGITVTNSGNNITVSLSDQITVGSGTNTVSLDGSKGSITAGQVTVNGESGTVNGLTNTTWDANNIVSGQAATEDQLKQVALTATQAATTAKSTVTAGDNITVSASKNADGSTNYQVSSQKDVTYDTVKSAAITSDKITVGNVVIDQTEINAGGNKITNVANGTISSTSTDAINGSQLNASNTTIYNYLGGGANYETNTAPSYNVGSSTYDNVGGAVSALNEADQTLNSKIDNVSKSLDSAFSATNNRIDAVEKKANAGIAAAMALEAAPYVAGKYTYAAGAAYHGGENAVGVTLRRTANNGRWSVTGGIAAASQGDPSFRIGISGILN